MLPKTEKEGQEKLLSGHEIQAEEQSTTTYIYQNVKYTETVIVNSNNSTKVILPVDKIVEKVLDNPNSVLVTDPFNLNTYYVFKSEKESQATCKEIENNIKSVVPKNNNKQNGDPGLLEIFLHRDFSGLIYGNIVNGKYYLKPWIDEDNTWWVAASNKFGIPDLRQNGYNDVISSYRVYGDYNDYICYKVIFYEHPNFGGKQLTAYANIYGHSLGYIWADTNLHGTLMQGGIFKRKYWGDQISSISWVRY